MCKTMEKSWEYKLGYHEGYIKGLQKAFKIFEKVIKGRRENSWQMMLDKVYRGGVY